MASRFSYFSLAPSIALVGSLSACEMPPKEPSRQCADFLNFTHHQKIPTPLDKPNFSFSSGSARPLQFYDPLQDRGPQNATAVMIEDQLIVKPTNPDFLFTVYYLSYHPQPIRVSVVDASGTISKEYNLPAAPQATVLSGDIVSNGSNVALLFTGGGREGLISKICTGYK